MFASLRLPDDAEPSSNALRQSITANRVQQHSDLVCPHREVANEVTACRFRKQSNPALTASKSSDDPPGEGRGERAAQKRELPRLGRPFDFQLHRARRCAKLIRCVSIFARKPANVTQRAAKPISITTQSRNISKIVVPRISQLRGYFPSYAEGRGRCEEGRKRNEKKDGRVCIAARILVDLGSTLCELRATYSGHATRFSTLLQLCNTSAAPSKAKRRATLFKYRSIIKLPHGLAPRRNLRAKLRAAPPVE